MSETTNLHLKLAGDSPADKAKTFNTWRKEINGEEATSNMQLIDAAYGEMAEDIEYKLDKPSTAGTNGQVLTSNGLGGQIWSDPSKVGGIACVDDGNGNITITNITESADEEAY